MVGLSISVSASAALGSLEVFTPEAMRKVQRLANNKTASQAAAKAASIGHKASGLDGKLKVSVAKRMVSLRKSKAGSTQASVRISHRPLNLIRFVKGQQPPGRRPKIGVYAKPYGKKRAHGGAFFMPLRGRGAGRWAVMKREAGAGRLPIEPLFGPSLYQVFKKRSAPRRELEAYIAEQHPKNMYMALKRELDRLRHRGRRR